jgi:Formin Homology 2 Domain
LNKLSNTCHQGGQDAAEKFDALCECEKFMVSMMTVKHAKRKVSAILFKLQFETCIRDIQKEAQLIEKACSELRNSSRLRQLFGIVLTFGNRLNTAGNGKRKAGAFTLDSLLKLREAKAFDKKTTFLHYIVMIVRRNNETLLDFKEDIPTVYEGDKIFWDQCIADLEQVENQLENVRKIALYQAHQSNAFRLRRRNKKEDPEESLTDDDLEMTLEEELETLRATHIGVFTLTAIKYVSALRENVESTKIMFARLLEYFGEEESAIQPHELFSTMVAFGRDFEKAKEEVFERENKRLREERKQEKQRTPVKTPQPQKSFPPQRSPMLRSSNLQPNMGSVLKQLKIPAAVPLRRTNSDGLDDRPVQAPTRQPEGSRPSDRHSDTSTSQFPASPSPQQPRESPQATRYASPFQEDEIVRSKPQTAPKSPRSPHSANITMSAMRAKTRLRRHLATPTKPQPQESYPTTSPISPSRFDSPSSRRIRASEAAPYDAGAEQPLSPRSPREQSSVAPAPALPFGETQLSPRTNSALRMKRRMQHRVRMKNTAV